MKNLHADKDIDLKTREKLKLKISDLIQEDLNRIFIVRNSLKLFFKEDYLKNENLVDFFEHMIFNFERHEIEILLDKFLFGGK